jgi:hypothetical protein
MCWWSRKNDHRWITSESEAFFSYVNWENVFTSSFTLSMIWWKKTVAEAENREIVENWMGFVNEVVEPLADFCCSNIL